MSSAILRVDDFRCHDERLVQILPGREDEAAEVALSLRDAGLCDGVFVGGKDVVDWGFVDRVRSLDRFFFSNVDTSFKGVDVTVLRNARVLGVSDVKIDLDLRSFERLSSLGYQWKSHPGGLMCLPSLREVSFWGVRKNLGDAGFGFPAQLKVFRLIGYADSRMDIGGGVPSLDVLSISRARSLTALPRLGSVKKLDVSFVGKDSFDYQTVPDDVEELIIDSCAPIQDWRFLEGKKHLRRLFIDRTKFVAPVGRLAKFLEGVEDVYIPSLRISTNP
ncbi:MULTISPECIES: hypothetical protein [unclassified Pseudoxanthomonas]|jgi:hypothetical protein|uniref:hypothetical protein n=1 Tax=unclassified Pseudoxanthomonas TaxID=2645906 RepID=UPI00307ECEBB